MSAKKLHGAAAASHKKALGHHSKGHPPKKGAATVHIHIHTKPPTKKKG